MEAIIGSYRARMEEAGMILTYTGGISFDLTVDETLELLDFISTYRQALSEMTIYPLSCPNMSVIQQLDGGNPSPKSSSSSRFIND